MNSKRQNQLSPIAGRPRAGRIHCKKHFLHKKHHVFITSKPFHSIIITKAQKWAKMTLTRPPAADAPEHDSASDDGGWSEWGSA